MTKFSLIAGVTQNLGIGFRNGLPWRRFPRDMKWFKNRTSNQTVIMGRRTWESMGGRPLPNRDNMVISSRPPPSDLEPNISFFTDLDSALKEVKTPEAFVIGGTQLYQASMNHPDCESLLITHAGIKLPADTFFPEITGDQFQVRQVLDRAKSKMVLHEPDESDELELEVPMEVVEYVPVPALPKNHLQLSQFNGEAGYLQALRAIIEQGEERYDRTGVGTKALFGLNFRYDLQQGYPLLTTKKMFTRGIIHELLWFLCGQTDNRILQQAGVHIWDGNSTREFLDKIGHSHRQEGDIGPSYGFQFRYSGAPYVDCNTDYTGQGSDQVAYVLHELKHNQHGRRAIINLWNPSQLSEMALPPCLFQYQFWVSDNQYLNCSIYQRSGDMGLGVPFNIASASLMTHIFGKLTGLTPKTLVHTIGDAHIYLNHLEPLSRQITRTPRPFPILFMKDRGQTKPEDFLPDDFEIHGYHPYPGIKMEMAV